MNREGRQVFLFLLGKPETSKSLLTSKHRKNPTFITNKVPCILYRFFLPIIMVWVILTQTWGRPKTIQLPILTMAFVKLTLFWSTRENRQRTPWTSRKHWLTMQEVILRGKSKTLKTLITYKETPIFQILQISMLQTLQQKLINFPKETTVLQLILSCTYNF